MKQAAKVPQAKSYVRLAERALKHAIADLIAERCRTGGSLVIWRNGKVLHVPAVKLAQAKSHRQHTA
jgi:hypothetical protein